MSLKSYSTNVLIYWCLRRMPDSETHGQSQVPGIVHSDERCRGRITKAGGRGSERLRKIEFKKSELKARDQNLKSLTKLPPFKFCRLRYSNTGEDGVRPLQTSLSRMFRSKGHINKAMPNDVMWVVQDRGGMGWLCIWDELSADRVATWIKMLIRMGLNIKRCCSGSEVRRADQIEYSCS